MLTYAADDTAEPCLYNISAHVVVSATFLNRRFTARSETTDCSYTVQEPKQSGTVLAVFACFTSTTVQILTPEALRAAAPVFSVEPVYLLY
jgi:hypothetical protein